MFQQHAGSEGVCAGFSYCVTHRRGRAAASVLLVLAVVTNRGRGVYAHYQVGNALQGSVDQDNAGIAMVQRGVGSLHKKHSAEDRPFRMTLASRKTSVLPGGMW